MVQNGDFLFVNASNPDQFRDKGAQRAVRRRVMRDIGKARRKNKHPPAVTFALQPFNPMARSEILKPPSPCLTSNPLPVELDTRALELIHFMSAEAEYNYRPFRKIWFSMALTDRSAFVLCKANAAMFLEQTRCPDTFRYEKCQETLTYYGQCVRQVTDRLSNPRERTSEGILTCILGLICHDLYVGTLDRWAYHIHGLAQIIRIRGGFQGLDEKVQLFASWFDVLGSVTKDNPPRLPSLSISFDKSLEEICKETHFEELLGKIDEADDDMKLLGIALRKAKVLAKYVNVSYGQQAFWRSEDDMSPLQLLGPITHDLLSMPRVNSLESSGAKLVLEMARIGLLILCSSLKVKYGFNATEMPALQEKLIRTVQNTTVDIASTPVQSLHLWALVTGAMLQPVGPERSLLIEKILRCMGSFDLIDAQSVVKFCQGIIWIEVIAQDKIASLIHDIDTTYADHAWTDLLSHR